MFNRKTIHDYYRDIQQSINQDILSQSDEDILGMDTQEYAGYLLAKYALAPIERNESQDCITSLVREQREYTDPFGDRGRGEFLVAQIEYPLVPHTRLRTALELFPSTQRSILPQFDFRTDRLILKVELSTLYGPTGSPPDGSPEINGALENLQWWLDQRNHDIQYGNAELKPILEQTINARKEFVARTRANFEAMVTKVTIPLKLRPATHATARPIEIRPELRPVLKKPTPKRPEEYFLRKADVEAVVELVKRYGRSLETTPHAVEGQDEPDIRALVLAQLNGLVDGDATGETFSKLGKSDIHLKLPKGDILIAECKVWSGAKEYGAAIDQLFGYLTWRECYGIIICFVRNRNLTTVLQQAEQAIRAHPTFRPAFRTVEANHFVSNHLFPDDPKRTVEVHHLFFHFPPQPN